CTQVVQHGWIAPVAVEDRRRFLLADRRLAIQQKLPRAFTLSPAVVPDVLLHVPRREAADLHAIDGVVAQNVAARAAVGETVIVGETFAQALVPDQGEVAAGAHFGERGVS